MKHWPFLILFLLYQLSTHAQKQDTTNLRYEDKDICVRWDPLPSEGNGKYSYHLAVKNKTNGFILLRLSDITLNGQPLPDIFRGEKEAEIAPGWPGVYATDISFSKPPASRVFLNGYTCYMPDTSYRERFQVRTDTQVVASGICDFKYSNFLTDRDPSSNMLILVYTNVKKDFVLDFNRAFIVTKEKVRSSFLNNMGSQSCIMVRKDPLAALDLPAFFFYAEKKVSLKDILYIDLSNAVLPAPKKYISIHTLLRPGKSGYSME